MMESSFEDVAFQVVANGSEFECFLVFRDALRCTPNLVTQYNELKHACEDLSEEDYRTKKSIFIEHVLTQTR